MKLTEWVAPLIVCISLSSCSPKASRTAALDDRLTDLDQRTSRVEQAASKKNSAMTQEESADADEKQNNPDQLLKMERHLQQTLPQVINYFESKRDDPGSVEATAHRELLKLCTELSQIVPGIISAGGDQSVSALITRQHEILRALGEAIVREQVAEEQARLTVSDATANLIKLDLKGNREILALLNP